VTNSKNDSLPEVTKVQFQRACHEPVCP
jgi:hypothetical protein